MAILGIDENGRAASDVQLQQAIRLGNVQPKCLSVVLLRFFEVID